MNITDEHVARVATANSGLKQALEKIREDALARAHGLLVSLSERTTAAQELINQTYVEVIDGLHALTDEVRQRLDREVEENIAAVVASDVAMRAELARRVAVLDSGLPPEPDGAQVEAETADEGEAQAPAVQAAELHAA